MREFLLLYQQWKVRMYIHPPNGLKTFFVCLLVLSTWIPAHASATTESDCQRDIRNQRLLFAAQCYVRLYQAIHKTGQAKQGTPVRKDHFLNRAALSYYHFAKRNLNPAQKAYYTEKAMHLLLRSFKQGYCEAADRCRSNRMLAEKLRQEIQYTPLVVVTGQKTARIKIVGYQFQQVKYAQYNRKIRPGRYTVTISFPGKRIHTKVVMLRPGFGITINVTPINLKLVEHRLLVPKKAPPLVVTGYTLGGLAFLTGAGIAIYGITEEIRLNGIVSNPLTARTLPAQEYESGFKQSQTVKTAGFVTSGAGLALLVSAIVAHVVTNRSTQKNKTLLIAKQAPLPKKKSLLLDTGVQP